MKKVELEDIMKNLKEITNVSSRQDYNTSTAINKLINPIMSTIKGEYDRLSADKVELNCPQMIVENVKLADLTEVDRMEIDSGSGDELDFICKKVTEYMNKTMESIIKDGCKIVDYGVNPMNNGIMYYIKYTE